MSTSSTISLLRKDGSVIGVYCNYDGYLSGVGKILKESYNTAEVLEKLFQFGDISCLHENIKQPEGEVHSFDEGFFPGVTVFYGRDRGETDCDALIYESYEEYESDLGSQQFDYLFKDDEWYVKDNNSSNAFVLLTDDMIEKNEND